MIGWGIVNLKRPAQVHYTLVLIGRFLILRCWPKRLIWYWNYFSLFEKIIHLHRPFVLCMLVWLWYNCPSGGHTKKRSSEVESSLGLHERVTALKKQVFLVILQVQNNFSSIVVSWLLGMQWPFFYSCWWSQSITGRGIFSTRHHRTGSRMCSVEIDFGWGLRVSCAGRMTVV